MSIRTKAEVDALWEQLESPARDEVHRRVKRFIQSVVKVGLKPSGDEIDRATDEAIELVSQEVEEYLKNGRVVLKDERPFGPAVRYPQYVSPTDVYAKDRKETPKELGPSPGKSRAPQIVSLKSSKGKKVVKIRRA